MGPESDVRKRTNTQLEAPNAARRDVKRQLISRAKHRDHDRDGFVRGAYWSPGHRPPENCPDPDSPVETAHPFTRPSDLRLSAGESRARGTEKCASAIPMNRQFFLTLRRRAAPTPAPSPIPTAATDVPF